MLTRSALFICLVIFTHCAVRTGELRNCGCDKTKSRVLDGSFVPAAQFPTVGQVGDATGVFCTGTLIAPNVVLCAAHCAADDKGAQAIKDNEGCFILGGVTYATRKIVIHPTYKGFVGDVDGQYDVSLLVLASPVPNITPTLLYRKTPATGTTLTIAGFGELGTGASGGNGNFPANGTIQTGTTTLERITSTFLHWNFDPGESDTASGDSGGPAFIDENGVRYIAGITSGGTGEGFNNDSFDTRVDAIAAWVDSVVAAQGNASGLIVSGPSTSKTYLVPGESVQLSAAGVPGVSFTWNFGDGSSAFGDAVSHAYDAFGAYVVTLTATKASTGENEIVSLTLLVADQSADANIVLVNAVKKRFLIQFTGEERSRFGITLENPAFAYADRTRFESALLGARVQAFFGSIRVDVVDITDAISYGQTGDSKLAWNYALGQVRYRLRGPMVNQVLERYGAQNGDMDSTLSVPFFLFLNGTRYGGSYEFQYKARMDRGGTGK